MRYGRFYAPGPTTLVGALALLVVLAIMFPWVGLGIVLAAVIVAVIEWHKRTAATIRRAREMLDEPRGG